MNALPDVRTIARALGGDVAGGQVRAPGPGHRPQDRSLTVRPDARAPDGFVVHSHADDDPLQAKDYVRDKLGLPRWEPARKADPIASIQARATRSRFVASYVYKLADGTPYLRVSRTEDKGFPQSRWSGGTWVSGKPPGPKIPYRLPELLASPDATVFIVEGEKDADNLAALGLVATTASEGAGNWTADLNAHFAGRTVYVLPDNDTKGADHALEVARNLAPVAAEVRVVDLPGLRNKGDVSDWLDASGDAATLVDLCRAAPVFDLVDNIHEVPTPAATGPSILFYGDKEPEPPPYIIKNVLPQKQVAILAGQHSAGKTFIGIDIALSTMTGEPFIDNEVEREGAVLWLAAEGASELAVRLKAAAVHRLGENRLGELPFAYQAFDVPTLTDVDAIPRLMALVDETKAGLATRFPGVDLVLIVLDTLNSAAGFQDENSASETQRVFNVLRKLSDASGALVLVIDHYGKMTETGVRGSSAKAGAADAILAALADKDETSGTVENRRLAVTKLRGAPTGRIVPFELAPVPVDVWGNTHCGIRWDVSETPATPKGKPEKAAWSGKGKLLKSCIERALLDAGSEQQPFGFSGPRVKAVPVDKVRAEFNLSYAAESQDAKRKAFKREFDKAVEANLIATREIGASLQDWVWFLERTDKTATKADRPDTP